MPAVTLGALQQLIRYYPASELDERMEELMKKMSIKAQISMMQRLAESFYSSDDYTALRYLKTLPLSSRQANELFHWALAFVAENKSRMYQGNAWARFVVDMARRHGKLDPPTFWFMEPTETIHEFKLQAFMLVASHRDESGSRFRDFLAERLCEVSMALAKGEGIHPFVNFWRMNGVMLMDIAKNLDTIIESGILIWLSKTPEYRKALEEFLAECDYDERVVYQVTFEGEFLPVPPAFRERLRTMTRAPAAPVRAAKRERESDEGLDEERVGQAPEVVVA